MPAKTPEDICCLFRQHMAEGDLDAVLSVYDPAPLAAAKPRFDFTIKQVVQAGEIALMHTEWSGPQPMALYAIEVARRQPDGTWRWLIGDPFTVGRT